MTMEEIRDLVLYTSSQNQMLLEQIENGHRMISDWANDIESGPGPEFVSEFVAVPVSQIGAAVPLDDESLYPIANKFEAQLVNADRNLSVELFTLHSASNWRPMLRGIKGVEHFEPDIMDYRHLLDSGEIALGCSVRRSKDSDYPNAQYEGWLCGYFAQALIAAERIRRHFGLSDFEFAISVHFWKASHLEYLPIHSFKRGYVDPNIGKLGPRDVKFPIYSTRSIADFGENINRFVDDLWSLFGKRPGRRIEVNWDIQF